MNTANSVLSIDIFGQGLRPRALPPEQYSGEYNWLYFVKDGALLYNDGRVFTTLKPNRFYVLPAFGKFILTDVKGKSFNHLYFKVKCSEPVREFVEADVSANPFLSDFFNMLMQHSNSLDTITVAMLLNTVFHLILPPTIRESDIAEKIKLFVDERLPRFSMRDIIDRFHYSKRYLDKKFKDAYNTSIIKYGKNERLAYGVKALAEGKTLVAVCDEIGYSSPANLSRDFKKHFGAPPLSYVKSD